MSNLWRPWDTAEDEVRPSIHDRGKKTEADYNFFKLRTSKDQRFCLRCIQVLKGNALASENLKNESL